MIGDSAFNNKQTRNIQVDLSQASWQEVEEHFQSEDPL